MAQRAMDKISDHEQVCAQRWGGVMQELTGLRKDMQSWYKTLIACLFTVVVALIGFIFVHMVH